MKNKLRDVLIAQLEKVNKVNAELKLRLSDVIKSLPDSEEIRIKADYRDWETDRKSTRLNSSHRSLSRMPSSA